VGRGSLADARDDTPCALARINVRRAPIARHERRPGIDAAVRAYASVGGISDALRDVFGTYREPALF
jgi:methylmalonyl-CoA mutase N-terminal domain/subunit